VGSSRKVVGLVSGERAGNALGGERKTYFTKGG
jgi:hypothetical protein